MVPDDVLSGAGAGAGEARGECHRRRPLRDRACEHQESGPERTGPADRREPGRRIPAPAPPGGRILAAATAGRTAASVITGSKITVSAAMRARDVSRAPEIAADDVPPAPARPPAGPSAGGRSSAKKAARRRAAAAQRAAATGGGPEPAGPELAGLPAEIAKPAASDDPAQSPPATAAIPEPEPAAGRPRTGGQSSGARQPGLAAQASGAGQPGTGAQSDTGPLRARRRKLGEAGRRRMPRLARTRCPVSIRLRRPKLREARTRRDQPRVRREGPGTGAGRGDGASRPSTELASPERPGRAGAGHARPVRAGAASGSGG